MLSPRRGPRAIAPYLHGSQTRDAGVPGPMNLPVTAGARNYYLATIFGEARLTGCGESRRHRSSCP